MDAIFTVKSMRDRYGCSTPTARKYLRMCNPHTEKPLTAPVWAVEEWEESRMVVPASIQRETMCKRNRGQVIVPRTW